MRQTVGQTGEVGQGDSWEAGGQLQKIHHHMCATETREGNMGGFGRLAATQMSQRSVAVTHSACVSV